MPDDEQRPFPELSAASVYDDDIYSQANRWKPGYSDCSSYVGKRLKALGVKPPGSSTTLSYMSSPEWVTISKSDVGAGDIAVNSAHMVIAMSNYYGIGQQRPHVNVQTGPIEDLMSGTGEYVYKRYTKGSGVVDAGFDNGIQQVGLGQLPGALVNTAKWLSDTTNWYRIGMVLGGAFLILLALLGTARTTKVLKVVTGAVKSTGKGKRSEPKA